MADAQGKRWKAYFIKFPTIHAYLLSKIVILPNGCWQWKTGSEKLYPQANYDHVEKPAHIASYEAFVGPVPKGKILRHTCDNRRCICPDHLIPGTKKDNRRDFMERHPRAMELCLAAAKTGAAGVKRFWEKMSADERAAFVKDRAEKQRLKRIENPEVYVIGQKARAAGVKAHFERKRLEKCLP
jgi:hypothetical protein